MKKCAFIYNSNTRNGLILNYKNAIIDILSDQYNVISAKTEKKYHSVEIVKELDNDFDLVLSCGGDGTFNEVLKGNIYRELADKNKFLLSHLPFGTTNDIGNTFYNTKNILKITKNIINGREIDLDVFQMNDDYFIYVAALGVFAKASYDTPNDIKKLLGHLAYMLSSLKDLFEVTPIELSYMTDNKSDSGKYSLVLASNSYSIGGMKFIILRDSNLIDGMFEFRILKYKSKFQTIVDILRIFSGNENISNLYKEITSAVNIKFNSLTNKYWSIDGEKNPNIYSEVQIKKAGTARLLVPTYTYKKLSV